MSQLQLDHHGKPGSTGRPLRPIVGLLSSVHPRPRLAEFVTSGANLCQVETGIYLSTMEVGRAISWIG